MKTLLHYSYGSFLMFAFLWGGLLQLFWGVVNSMWSGDPFNISWTLVQVMATCLKAISHYLHQCWLIIGQVVYELNFFAETHIYYIYICILYIFLLHQMAMCLKSFPMQHIDLLILQSEYHQSWWPSNARSHSNSSHYMQQQPLYLPSSPVTFLTQQHKINLIHAHTDGVVSTLQNDF